MGFLDELLNKGKRALKREATRVARRELKKLGLETPRTTPGRSRPPRSPQSTRRTTGSKRTSRRTVPDDATWYTPDRIVHLHGRAVNLWGYVGTTLAKHSGKGNDPALFHPRLPLQPGVPGTDPKKIDYGELTPVQRHAYVTWMTDGRRDPSAAAWIPRLFVYGLERRVIVDLAPRLSQRTALTELREIGEELAELRDLYDDKHIAALFDTVLILRLLAGDPLEPVQSAEATGMVLQLLMARAAAQGKPLDPDLAWAWARQNGRSLVIKRQPALARQLFHRRYSASPAGRIVLTPVTPADAMYLVKAGNPGVRDLEIDISALPGWSDPAGELAAIAELFTDVSTDLANYDRASRAEGFEAESLAALSLLPAGLLDAAHPTLARLRQWLEDVITKPYGTPVPASSLLAEFSVNEAKPSRTDSERIASLLERLGYGIQPDVRVSGDRFAADSRVVLFRMPQPIPMDTDLTATLLQLRFATAVAMANRQMSQAELTAINTFIEQAAPHPSVRGHLYARLIYLSLTPVKLTGLSKRVQALTAAQAESIASFLLTLATCEGSVSPEEMVVLGKIWKLLGLKPESLSSSLHQSMTITSSATSPELSEERIARTQQETELISGLLGEIFAEEEPPAAPPVEHPAHAMGTLNAGQSALLRELLERGVSLSRAEFTALAEKHSVLPNGALDAINSYALETCDEPLLEEDGDMLMMNEWARDQLTV